jgi:uncharacterized protein YdhG (YjbR/CyaY superfamily)
MNDGVDAYIQKQKSPQREICQELRKLIFEIFPDAGEEMKWGVPAFAGGKFYIVALKDHVNLGFSTKGLSRAEVALFNGGGKATKHIEIGELQGIDGKRIEKLLRLVGET